MECGEQADEQADQRREAGGECERRVSMAIAPARGNSGGAECQQRVERRVRQDDSEDAADRREQQRLGEQLADDPRSRCAERSPYRSSLRRAAPCASSRLVTFTQAIVRSRMTAPSNGEQRRPDASRELVLQRIGDEAVLKRGPLRPRKLRQRRSRDRVELLARVVRSTFGSHTTHEAQVMTPLPAVQREVPGRTCSGDQISAAGSARSRSRAGGRQ